MACSLPGFSVHGIFQAWILEWVAICFSRGSSQGSNLYLLHWQANSLPPSHQGSHFLVYPTETKSAFRAVTSDQIIVALFHIMWPDKVYNDRCLKLRHYVNTLALPMTISLMWPGQGWNLCNRALLSENRKTRQVGRNGLRTDQTVWFAAAGVCVNYHSLQYLCWTPQLMWGTPYSHGQSTVVLYHFTCWCFNFSTFKIEIKGFSFSYLSLMVHMGKHGS